MSDSPENLKSDVPAKQAFRAELEGRGFTVSVLPGPVDVVASKDGITWLYEIKFTRAPKRYFGAATLTEWEAALLDPDHFRFVIADFDGNSWRFDEYTVEEFMTRSSIPPFKIFFDVALGKAPIPPPLRESQRIWLTEERLKAMSDLYSRFKKGKI